MGGKICHLKRVLQCASENILLDPGPRISKVWMTYRIVSGTSVSENIAPFLLLEIAAYS